MSNANVLGALDKQGGNYKRPALSNILIYGRVRCLIDKPEIVGDSVQETNGYFAILDAYALKCLGDDYFREGSTYDVNSVYFTKGSILIYIDKEEWVGKDVKVYGKSKYYGATIRRQNSKKPEQGISAFMFGPPVSAGRRSVYPLVPNVLVELSDKDPDARGTALEDFLVSVAKKGDIPYPETLDSIIPYSGTDDYKELSVKEEKGKDVIQNKTNTFINDNSKVDVSKIDMKLTYHLSGQDRSKYFDSFKDDIVDNSLKRKSFVKDAISELSDLYSKYGVGIPKDIKIKFIDRVASDCNRRLGTYSTLKCIDYVNIFVDNLANGLIGLSSDKSSGSTDAIFNTKVGIDKLKNMVKADSSVLWGDTGDADIDKIPALEDDFTFTVNVISTCTGIDFSILSNSLRYCMSSLGITDYVCMFMLLSCPYYLGLFGVGLDVSDCDLLYYSFDTEYSNDNLKEINNKYRSYLVMLDTLDSCSKGVFGELKSNRGINTFVKIGEYKSAKCCYSAKTVKNIHTIGFVANPDIKSILELLLGKNLSMSGSDIGSILKEKWYSEEVFKELCQAGIVNTLGNTYCALERNIEQEFLIYEVFESLGKAQTGIDDDVIEEVINDFEKDRGFKLESLQKEGIKLCKYRAGVLSGCAGSGKTTTSDCMTEVLKTLDGYDKIVYCTPTGKACRRLAEVVHSTVKTIHSQFNVRIGGSSYLQDAYINKKDDAKSGTVYIFDEMAMCNTELMYSIAKNICKNDIVYFLGDVKQLPPIGGGCPFKLLMTILPCVELGVSKRAAEGSLVNYNTSLINFMSDGVCRELLYDDKTFIEKDCPDSHIVSVVKNMFDGFISGKVDGTKYPEDDIQVITGYQKKERLSSTTRLNKPLQDLLRRNDKVLYYREVRTNGEENEPYYANDRVIYVNKNSYDICRYVYENGVFHQVATFGCVNGEMGKLIGVVRSTDVVFQGCDPSKIVAGEGFYSNVDDEELKMIVERFESKSDDLRSDNLLCHEDYYFVLVKVYDTDLRRDVIALLRGKGRFVGSDFCISGSDLNNLNLAYALTCHKMQGSQSKVVIAAFESSGSPDFLNRNMINTIITRSQGVVCCVGSVLGPESMINRGRVRVSKTDSRDLLSILSGTAKWL